MAADDEDDDDVRRLANVLIFRCRAEMRRWNLLALCQHAPESLSSEHGVNGSCARSQKNFLNYREYLRLDIAMQISSSFLD